MNQRKVNFLMEDKKKICEALLPVLQMTRNLDDLKDLYYSHMSNGDEYVEAVFENGSKLVNVTADSGVAMIKDIVKKLMY